MSYDKFIEEFIEQYGDFFTEAVTMFFLKAIELAEDEKYEDAIKLGRQALNLAKYSHLDSERVYLLGMLSQAYLDNEEPEMADKFFTHGIKLLDKNDEDYESDVDRFLDIKIIIDKELKKKGVQNEF